MLLGCTDESYVLDTATYPNKTLIDQGLSDYQGPALLIYNDAVFVEDDFESLRRLGDSVKMQNKLATGKFGLGFNSVCDVYNVTDLGLWLDRHAVHPQWPRFYRLKPARETCQSRQGIPR